MRLDRLALLENARRILAIVSTTSIPTFDFQKLRKPIWALCAGVPVWMPITPKRGGLFARRFTQLRERRGDAGPRRIDAHRVFSNGEDVIDGELVGGGAVRVSFVCCSQSLSAAGVLLMLITCDLGSRAHLRARSHEFPVPQYPVHHHVALAKR